MKRSLRPVDAIPLTVRSRRFPGSEELNRLVTRHLGSTTNRFGERIRSIVVCLDDVNGSRGGVDKSCRVELSMADGDTIHVRGLGATLEAAIAAAAPRTRSVLVRKIGRSRTRRDKY